MKLLIGADPEFFVQNDKGNIVPAVGMVAGDKYNPLACLRGAMQVDGLALEFNIDPAASLQEFELNMKAVMRHTLQEARKTTKNPLLKISTQCHHKFGTKEFEAIDEKSKELGCSASYDRRGVINIPASHVKQPVRVVGGHLHLGWIESNDANTDPNSVHFRDCARLATWLDGFVQFRLARHLENTMSRNDFKKLCEKERVRKTRYGKYSEFRCKPYGMEYRSLSNFWIHNAELRALAYQYTQQAFELAVKFPEEVEAAFYGFSQTRGSDKNTEAWALCKYASYAWYTKYEDSGTHKYVNNYIETMLKKLEG